MKNILIAAILMSPCAFAMNTLDITYTTEINQPATDPQNYPPGVVMNCVSPDEKVRLANRVWTYEGRPIHAKEILRLAAHSVSSRPIYAEDRSVTDETVFIMSVRISAPDAAEEEVILCKKLEPRK